LSTLTRITVGPAPSQMTFDPGGRFLVVTQRFARYASIVDTHRDAVVGELETPYYTEGVAFSPDGARLYVTNTWRDEVREFRVTSHADRAPTFTLVRTRTVPNNPRRVVVSVDGRRLLVTSETDLALTMLDAETFEIVATHSPNAPVTDAAFIGRYVYALHTGSGTNHPPDEGFDGDHDGAWGDGTANVGFQDLQNEIDVLDARDLALRHRYTSDTICCRDFRDVDPDRPESGADLAPIDRWPPGRIEYLPPRATWIVAGAMPERLVEIAVDGRPAVAVVFGGSSEVQTFAIDDETGALRPLERAGELYRTGHGAIDAVALGRRDRLVVVDRLGETLTAIDLTAPARETNDHVIVGDVSDGAFPATDVELGEAFNTMTALFTVDGDQTCVHCHRDGTPIGKPISMPLFVEPQWGLRSVMSYRAAYDSRPWFVEAGMDQNNFFPVINEFARKENFCCEQLDPRVWSRYPTFEECTSDPDRSGCNHVLHCIDDPPAECAERPYGATALTRDEHFRAAAQRVFGRDETYGDALYTERAGAQAATERRPLRLAFDGITRALGLFLLARARILPNPNAATPSSVVDLGRTLFHSAETGCASCHPLPVGATARGTVVTMETGPISFPALVTPQRNPLTDANVDRITQGFLTSFPDARQTDLGLRIGAASLRGAWERSRFLHHGAARSLREVIATPGHEALRPGERGLNEVDGQPNTHGGTSQLTARELDALVAFVETL
jgi:hypothetical protein